MPRPEQTGSVAHLAEGQAVGMLREVHQQPASSTPPLLRSQPHTSLKLRMLAHPFAAEFSMLLATMRDPRPRSQNHNQKLDSMTRFPHRQVSLVSGPAVRSAAAARSFSTASSTWRRWHPWILSLWHVLMMHLLSMQWQGSWDWQLPLLPASRN